MPSKPIFALLSAFAAASLTGASSTPSAPPESSPPPPCIGAEFRQFDFWVGNWNVKNPKGKQVGTNEISRGSEGCVIREQWKSASGGTGMSINYYDPDDRKWHQDWVGGDGLILHLKGELVGNAMIMRGPSKTPKGTLLNEVSWTPTPEGEVKQQWRTSTDGGKSWETVFLGIYGKN